MNMNSSRRSGNCRAGVCVARVFRSLRGIAAGLAVLAAAGVAPAHAADPAIIPAGPPKIDLVPRNGNFFAYWLISDNPGIPPYQYNPYIRYREVGHDWSSHTGGAQGIEIRLDVNGGHDRFCSTYLTTIGDGPVGFVLVHPGRPCDTSGLNRHGATLEVQMAHFNGVLGEWSALHRVTTTTPYKPRNPMVTPGVGGFKIDWTSGDTTYTPFDGDWPVELVVPATGHRVRWREAGKSAYSYADNLAAGARSYLHGGLETSATYYVSVAATSKYGTGPWTAELPVIADGPPQVTAWVGKVGGIDVRWANDTDATKEAVRWRNPGLRPLAEWTSIEVANPTGHYQLSHEDNGIEPGGRYEVQVRGFVDADGDGGAEGAWQDWSPSGIARSSTHDDLAPRLRWMAVSEANGDLRMTEPAVSSEVFAYSVYIPSAIALADFAVQPQTRATKIVVTAPDDSDFADVTVVREKAKVPLTAGEGKTVTLELTSRLGGLSTYTLTIKRDRLRAMELVAAEVNAETLSPTDIVPGVTLPLVPAFAPEVRSYDLSVSHHVPKLRLRLAADSTAVSSIAYFNELDADSKFAPVNYPVPLAGRLEDLDDNAGRELKEFALAVGKTQLVIRLHDTGGNEIDQYHIYITRAAQLFLPDMPQTVTAEAGIAQIHVAWTAPRNLHGDAGLERSGYRLRWRYVPAGHAQDYGHWQDATGDNNRGELLAADATSHTIAGRLYFLPHEVQIAAVNASGIGAWVGAKTAAVKVPAPDAIYELITTDAGDAQLRVQLPLNRTHTKTGFVNFSPHTIADYGVQIKSADATDWPEVQLSGAHILPAGITRISTEEESEKGMFLFSGIASAQSYDVRAFYTYHDLINNHPAPGPFSPSTRINTAAPNVA
ncbi:MAG: fibronectin type III domain-containing protein, partial [Gammaproteobacteria bacterium]